MHAARAVDGQPLRARAHDRDRPAVIVGELAERGPSFGALADGTDRIGRHERDPVVDAIRNECVAEAEPFLVVPECEVRQGVGAVPLHEEAGAVARHRPVGRDVRDHCWSEQQPTDPQRDADADREQRRRQQHVDAVRERDRGDADQSFRDAFDDLREGQRGMSERDTNRRCHDRDDDTGQRHDDRPARRRGVSGCGVVVAM